MLSKRFIMIVLFGCLLSIVAIVLAGSPCPPRESIYPCSCLSLPQGKKVFFTSITCHRLHNTDSLMGIFPALRTMNIDHFYLYDSFWEANKLGTSEGENQQVLPTDWITLLKIKEIEIVDTTMSSCFACQSKMSCRNGITTRFTAVNSSSHEKICTVCDMGGIKYSWTGCMSKLRQFHFRQGGLTVVRADLFPMPMRELTEVDLSYNQIMKVEARAFHNTPRLKILNLSHNALQSLDAMFASQKLEALELLDVSWNLIKSLGSNLFVNMPGLKTFKADNNYIVDMKETEWKNVGEKLRIINLTDNPIHCHCNILWINDTFHINTVVEGFCATPEDYENTPIRRASRLINTRGCDKNGEFITKSTPVRTKKPKPTKSTF